MESRGAPGGPPLRGSGGGEGPGPPPPPTPGPHTGSESEPGLQGHFSTSLLPRGWAGAGPAPREGDARRATEAPETAELSGRGPMGPRGRQCGGERPPSPASPEERPRPAGGLRGVQGAGAVGRVCPGQAGLHSWKHQLRRRGQSACGLAPQSVPGLRTCLGAGASVGWPCSSPGHCPGGHGGCGGTSRVWSKVA